MVKLKNICWKWVYNILLLNYDSQYYLGEVDVELLIFNNFLANQIGVNFYFCKYILKYEGIWKVM